MKASDPSAGHWEAPQTSKVAKEKTKWKETLTELFQACFFKL
jgi:hypothetical protein